MYCLRFALPLQRINAKLRKMIKISLLSMLIIAIAVALMCVRLFVIKDGTIKSQHIKDNPYLKSKNIHCVLDQDREARARKKKINND